MNPYLKNLQRIEFIVTHACTGRCKHCSEADSLRQQHHPINAERAAEAVKSICAHYRITSVMTFGGEPLLCPEAVCRIHAAARDCGVAKRQLITNGFFSRDPDHIRSVAHDLVFSGVNDILLSVDAFHQETIPLQQVYDFAAALKAENAALRLQPAWIVGPEGDNPYDRRTAELLACFHDLDIAVGEGNIVFPAGNALKYLAEYFDPENLPVNPYEEDPHNLSSVSILPNGELLTGNIYHSDAPQILQQYRP